MTVELRQRREHELAVRSERVHGILRIAGGIAGVGLLVWDGSHPDIVWRGELAQWLLYVAVGIATVAITVRRSPGEWIESFRGLTLTMDAVVLLSQIPLHSYVGGHVDPSPALLVPLLAGIKYAWRGLAMGMGSLLLAEAVWATQATTIFGVGDARAIEEIILNSVMGLALGSLAAHLAHTAEASRRTAWESADRAEAAAITAAQAQAEVEALHDVLRAGLGLSEVAAAEQMVAMISRSMEADVVLQLELADSDAPVLLRSHSRRVAGDRGKQTATIGVGPEEQHLGTLHITTSGAGLEPPVLERLADQVAVALKAARELDQQAQMADRHRELERLKTDFISITSHELRTPLGSIVAAADTLFERSDMLGEETRLALTATVMRNAARLQRLVDDLLVVGRHDAGVLPFRPMPVRAHRLVTDAVETCDDVRVRVREGPPAMVNADPMRVNQILVNLINNAATHGQPPVELTWKVNDNCVVLQVIDQGPGIDEADRDRVFDRFVQLSAVDKHTSGTGLGLPIARDLARAMGGDVRIDTTPEGTVASLRLQLSAEREPVETNGTSPHVARLGAA